MKRFDDLHYQMKKKLIYSIQIRKTNNAVTRYSL